ncbi:MAG: two-component sensor histidine kinase [Thermoleophilia bacterium]|nr:two-component sensor histidine kinase [Thermoleophilia bacterium]
MMSPREQARHEYREALARYIDSGSEDALETAYSLGRDMLTARVPILDLVTDHGSMLPGLIGDGSPTREAALQRATEFLCESVAPFAMIIHGYDESVGALQQRVSQLQSVDEMKNDFIHMIVHDMKNPLVGARALSQILVSRWDTVDETRRRELCTSILDCTDSAMRLVNDVLALTRLELDDAVVTCAACDIGEVAAKVAGQLGQSSSGGRVEVSTVPDLPPVWADADRQRRILENLVSNALKFSPSDEPVVIDIRPLTDDLVEIRVTDHGPGIALENQPRLFQRFGRISTPGYEHVEGSGIGLYATKRMVEEHGGTIRVSQNASGGSSFTYTVPTAAFGRKFLSPQA